MPRDITEELERWYEVVHGKGEGISFEEKVMIMLKSIDGKLSAIHSALMLIALLELAKFRELNGTEEELLENLVSEVLY